MTFLLCSSSFSVNHHLPSLCCRVRLLANHTDSDTRREPCCDLHLPPWQPNHRDPSCGLDLFIDIQLRDYVIAATAVCSGREKRAKIKSTTVVLIFNRCRGGNIRCHHHHGTNISSSRFDVICYFKIYK